MTAPRRTPVRLFALALLCIGCGGGLKAAVPAAEPWAEASRLFRSDPRWLGADGAYSVGLGDGRVLWLFGDTFVARRGSRRRQDAALVRNTVAIQHGRHPADASVDFVWREVDGAPRSFFPGSGERWLWPLHGIRLGGALTLFLLEEKPASGGLGFETVGWRAVRVDDPAGPPLEWDLERLPAFDAPFDVVVGSSLLVHDGYVHAYAVQEPGDHEVYLLRWERGRFLRGELQDPEWHDGSDGWVAHAALGEAPQPVFRSGQTELSVHRHGAQGRFVAVQSRGFGATTVAVRTAPAPEGPWSPPRDVFRPPESDRPGALVYAAKAHPALAADGELAITYVSSSADPSKILTDPALYYPRFLRIDLGL